LCAAMESSRFLLAPRSAEKSSSSSSGPPRESDEECALRLQREFDAEVAAKEARERFSCPLCLDTVQLSDGVELDCLHRLCRGCLSGYLEVKIREKRVLPHELCCPMPGCDCEVTTPQIEYVVTGTPLWDRFLATRVELWRPADEERERLCECPRPECSGTRFLAPAELVEVSCPRCTARFCPRCRDQHPGTSCEAHLARLRGQVDQADKEFDELVRKECWQRCPGCQAVCERPHGCNYMTCYSEKCRGKTTFCYLCGDKLSSIEHFTHFPYGLFENACQKLDRRNEENLPQATWGTRDWWSSVARDLTSWATG